MLNRLSPYRKAVVAFLIGVLQLVALYITLSADGTISAEDKNALISNVILALGGTGAVYQVRNKRMQ